MKRALLLLPLLAACGGGESSVLADAEDHLAGLEEATIDLELSATAGDSGPVGFRMQGPFSFESAGDLPVLDLTYTRLLGDEEQEVRVVSDGTSVSVEQDGETTEVPEGELGALRLGDGEGTGIEDLGLEDWVEDPETTESGSTTTVTGRLDGAAMLRDLNRIVAEVGGAEGLAQLDDDTAAELEDRVRDSSIEVVTEGDEHRLRSLDASLDFGRDVPPALEDALGPYAAARVRLRLTLS